MSEEKDKPEEFQVLPKDYVVMDISDWANKGNIFVGASISIGGTIYSGTVISGKEWCLRHIALYQAANIGSDFKDGMINYFNMLIDKVYNEEAISKAIATDYIHMEVKFISNMASANLAQSLWRFKISEVEGIFFGEFSK
ncbi:MULTISPECIES: hypothetical protein [Providencia]|uniref:hypothetical protein n=1 Tax=Providencia TaxID=586 RepID=UPI000D8C0757|nr:MULTISPECIES: hypothetical protein [Providencia]MTC26822.1 hypothetical protein [Providencia alcalifaciens]SPY71429.1 Uncharacterised protein [Providencia alcalifaciens]